MFAHVEPVQMVMVSINQVAEELKVTPRHALRLVKKRADSLGIIRHFGKRQAVFLSREDADRLINNYEPRLASLAAPPNDAARATGFGFFYLIQLLPEDLPTRVKIGYTDNLDVRQSDHRTSAPTLKLLRSWPCKRTWEESAKASITRDGCRRIGGEGPEVFDGDVQGFIDRADAFFALMPHPPVIGDPEVRNGSS